MTCWCSVDGGPLATLLLLRSGRRVVAATATATATVAGTTAAAAAAVAAAVFRGIYETTI